MSITASGRLPSSASTSVKHSAIRYWRPNLPSTWGLRVQSSGVTRSSLASSGR